MPPSWARGASLASTLVGSTSGRTRRCPDSGSRARSLDRASVRASGIGSRASSSNGRATGGGGSMGALGKFLLRRRARARTEPRLLAPKPKGGAPKPKTRQPWVTVRDEHGTMQAKIIEREGPPGEVRVQDRKGNRWYVKRSAITPKSALR